MKHIILVVLMLSAATMFSPVQAGWVSVPIPAPIDGISDEVRKLYFIHPDTGWAVGGRSVWKTTDHGRNWQQMPYPSSAPPVSFLGVYFMNSLEGWVVGSNATTMHTIDGGQTWEVQIWQEAYIHLWSIQLVGNELWSVGAGWGPNTNKGVLFRSADRGKNWSRTDFESTAFLNLEKISEDNVWLIGSDIALQTMNQGHTWLDLSESLKGAETNFRRIVFLTKTVGYMVGPRNDDWGGKLYATNDGGQTWTLRKVWGHELQAYGIGIVGNTIYIAGGDANLSGPGDVASIVASNDGGYNWREVARGLPDFSTLRAGIFQLDTADSTYLWAAGNTDFWYLEPNHTPKTDGATANGRIPIGQQYEYFVKATDPDGDSLSYHFLKAPGFLYIDEKTGRIWGTPAVGDVGNHLIVVEVSDPYGATATLTVVWTFGDEQSTAVEDEELAGIPAKFALEQNYPNPFNPATTIGYSLAQDGHIRLSVYDLTGQEVITLILGWQEAGVYSINFDASNLPSGVYLYRLVTDMAAETKKMILVK